MTSAQADQYLQEIDTDSVFVVELDGDKIPKFLDYFYLMREIFKFPPIDLRPSLDGYHDWMCDLESDKDGFLIVIRNYNKFLSRDKKAKQEVLRLFTDRILPWWEKDIIECVVDGEPKSFNVILVQDNPAE
jgi:hypothetical protein